MNPIRGWFREIKSIFSFNRTRGLATAVASRSQAGRNLKQGCGGVAILASSCHVLIIFPLMRSTCPMRSIDPYAAAHLSKGPLSKNENPVDLKRIPVNQASIRGIDLVYSGLLLIFLRTKCITCNFSFVHENILYLKHAIFYLWSNKITPNNRNIVVVERNVRDGKNALLGKNVLSVKLVVTREHA